MIESKAFWDWMEEKGYTKIKLSSTQYIEFYKAKNYEAVGFKSFSTEKKMTEETCCCSAYTNFPKQMIIGYMIEYLAKEKGVFLKLNKNDNHYFVDIADYYKCLKNTIEKLKD